MPVQDGEAPPRESSLLPALGARVRSLRRERAWSRRDLAAATGLSERFLAQVEMGKGNPSVLSLERIAAALSTSPAALLATDGAPRLIALLGLRGAGKSTLGGRLAERLGLPFIELDARIEEASGLSLREIFELHGEDYYRRLERDALEAIIGGAEPAVLATGGSLVTHSENFELLARHAVTLWLRATPEEHWSRVVAQGDHRPMANDPLAMERLRELLARREGLYAEADHTVSTSGESVERLVDRLAAIAGRPARS